MPCTHIRLTRPVSPIFYQYLISRVHSDLWLLRCADIPKTGCTAYFSCLSSSRGLTPHAMPPPRGMADPGLFYLFLLLLPCNPRIPNPNRSRNREHTRAHTIFPLCNHPGSSSGCPPGHVVTGLCLRSPPVSSLIVGCDLSMAKPFLTLNVYRLSFIVYVNAQRSTPSIACFSEKSPSRPPPCPPSAWIFTRISYRG